MKVYPKRLKGVRQLQREKKRVKADLAALDQEGWQPKKAAAGNSSKNDASRATDGFNALLGFNLASNPVASIILKIIDRRLVKQAADSGKSGGKNTGNPPATVAQKAKLMAKRVGIDFVTGYLKWKAIEVTYKIAKKYIKQRNAASKNKQQV